MTAPLLHVADLAGWRAARSSGRYLCSTRGLSYEEVGFVHCATPQQVDGVLARFYADVAEPLVLLQLDPALVRADGVEVRWEAAVPGGEEFPHLYAALDPAWVVRELTVDQVPDASA